MPPLEIVVGVRESLMLLVNSHILKMAAMSKASAEYNRRAAIIEGLRAGRSATEIIRFFRYPRSTVYDVVIKYTALEQSNEDSSMPARKSHSKECIARTRSHWKGSSSDFGWLRAIVAKISIDWCKRANNASEGHMFFSRTVHRLIWVIWFKIDS